MRYWKINLKKKERIFNMPYFSLKKYGQNFFLLVVACGFILLAGCSTRKAIVKKDGLSPKDSENAVELFKEGASLLYVDNNSALEKFDMARKLDPNLIAAHFNAGVALEALSMYEQALQRYEDCLAIRKEQPYCLANLLLVMAKVGKINEAKLLAAQYVQEYSSQAFPKAALAKLLLFLKDFLQAEKLAREAIELDADNVEALFVMARIFYERKQHVAAKWTIKNALEVAPSHGGLYLLLGHIEKALDLFSDALDAYALAVKFQPTREALENYGLLLLKRGRSLDALQVLQRLVEIYPANFSNYLHLGNAYTVNAMFEEAKTAYLQALELEPDSKDVIFNLGLLYFDLKPDGMSELERLTTARSYLNFYLEKKDLSSEQVKEANEYLKEINRKIEIEEYEAEEEVPESIDEDINSFEDNEKSYIESQPQSKLILPEEKNERERIQAKKLI
jgi:tetratricopeptide (TPR) repeat protein